MNVGDGQPQCDGPCVRQPPSAGHQAHRDEPQEDEAARRGDHVIDGKRAFRRKQQNGRHQAEAGNRHHDPIAQAKAAAIRLDLIAKQRRDRDVVGPPERREREGQRRPAAIEKAFGDLAGIEGGRERKRQNRTKGRHEGERHRGAQDHADDDAQSGNEHHLEQHQAEDIGACGAERLHRRDRRPLAVDEAADRVGDAGPADDQRGQADEGEELGEAVEILGELRRDVFSSPHFPPGVGKCLCRLGDESPDGQARRRLAWESIRQRDPIEVADERARLHQAGRREGLVGHQHTRAEADAGGEFVRLLGQGRAEGEYGIADMESVADLEPEPRLDRHVGNHAVDATVLGQGVEQRQRGIEHHRAGGRIVRADGLDLDQGRRSVVASRHPAQHGNPRKRAVRREEGLLGRTGLALDEIEGGIAPQNGPALLGETVAQRMGYRTDAGDRRDTQGDAAEEDAEAGEAAPQVTQRQPHQERQPRPAPRLTQCAVTSPDDVV